MNQVPANLNEGLQRYCEQLRALGIEQLYLPPEALKLKPAGHEEALLALHDSIRDCTRCKLCQGRTQVVFGTGDPNAELVFVGEAPGADEDRQGVPFVGRAGQLLTRMIASMGLDRDQVYICNVIKCRPPDNRNPERDEIASCEPFLIEQLNLIRPQVIVTLGKFAAQTLLRTDTPISRLRGHWHEYQGIPLMPTFHPSYLLRGSQEKIRAEKLKVWNDLQQVMAKLGLKRPS